MLKSMLQHLRDAQAKELEGEGAAEAGFTLIELMVVLLIIAILLAIAIPTFLGVTGSANDRAAQSNLTNAMTEAAAVYQNQGQAYDSNSADTTSAQFTAALVTAMGTSAPEFQWSSGAVSAKTAVSVLVSSDDQEVILAAYSPGTKTCWEALTTNGDQPVTGFSAITQSGLHPGTWYAEKTSGPPTNCTATAFAGNWGSGYSGLTAN